MNRVELTFDSQKSKKANKAWGDAIELLGGPNMAAEISGIPQPRISYIYHGKLSKNKKHRTQVYPSIEQAIKISLAVNKKITAEELIPHHDFDYIYQYCKMENKNE